ncbi:MAG: radical SAM protein [Promethearchaeota archaeon]
MGIRYQTVKSHSKVLNLYPAPDSWFWVAGSINPFRGCEHNCIYCDGKAEWYRIHNFGTHIRVKVDAAKKYEKELLKLGYRPDFRPKRDTLESFISISAKTQPTHKNSQCSPIAVGGGVCDLYQPAEKKFKVARQILTISRDFGIPVSILTKSTLVLRDLDIISEINNLNYANVSFSITLFEENVRKIFEPNSPSTSKRFQALEIVRHNKLHGGIILMPILPGIGDREENLKSIIQKARDVNAEFILPGGLTLKPGRNKREYLKTIKQHFPSLISLYQDLYSNNNQYGAPIPHSKMNLNASKIVHEYCRKFGISDRIPRYIPPGVYQKNYLLSTILHNLAYYYQNIKEKPWRVVSPYTKGAKAIEISPIDISHMSIKNLRTRFKLPLKICEVVSEVLETGKSTDLCEFQEPNTILAN